MSAEDAGYGYFHYRSEENDNTCSCNNSELSELYQNLERKINILSNIIKRNKEDFITGNNIQDLEVYELIGSNNEIKKFASKVYNTYMTEKNYFEAYKILNKFLITKKFDSSIEGDIYVKKKYSSNDTRRQKALRIRTLHEYLNQELSNNNANQELDESTYSKIIFAGKELISECEEFYQSPANIKRLNTLKNKINNKLKKIKKYAEKIETNNANRKDIYNKNTQSTLQNNLESLKNRLENHLKYY